MVLQVLRALFRWGLCERRWHLHCYTFYCNQLMPLAVFRESHMHLRGNSNKVGSAVHTFKLTTVDAEPTTPKHNPVPTFQIACTSPPTVHPEVVLVRRYRFAMFLGPGSVLSQPVSMCHRQLKFYTSRACGHQILASDVNVDCRDAACKNSTSHPSSCGVNIPCHCKRYYTYAAIPFTLCGVLKQITQTT